MTSQLLVIVDWVPVPYLRAVDDRGTDRFYTGESGRAYHQVKRGIPAPAVPWVARARVEKLARHVKPTDRVFEFGVGAGWNLASLTCQRRVGYDIAVELVESVEKQGIEFVGDFSKVPRSSFDIVLLHHALEHLIAPAETLKRIRELLGPNGKLLVFVPYERESRFRHFTRDEPNHHLYSWNPQSLGNLVESCGFQVIEAGVGEFGYDRFSSVWSHRLRMGEIGYRAIRRCCHLFRPGRETRVVATPANSPCPTSE